MNGTVHQVYDREGSVVEQLAGLMSGISRFRDADPGLAVAADRLDAVILDLQDITHTLRNYALTIDLDPESLDTVDQRLDLISKLKRKYGGSLNSLFTRYRELEQQLDQTLNMDCQIQERIKEKKCWKPVSGRKPPNCPISGSRPPPVWPG